jgi:hypothetical protein
MSSNAMHPHVMINLFAHAHAGATDWSEEAREAANASPGTTKWQAIGV